MASKCHLNIPRICVECGRHLDRRHRGRRAGNFGRVSNSCSMTLFNLSKIAFIWYEVGRLDILWSVNELARAVTKWTRACDGRLAFLISYIHNASGQRQHCHVGKYSTALSSEELFNIGTNLVCLCKSNVRSHKLDVQEANFSFHTVLLNLRIYLVMLVYAMDGSPVLDLWDLLLEVLHSSSQPKAQGHFVAL